MTIGRLCDLLRQTRSQKVSSVSSKHLGRRHSYRPICPSSSSPAPESSYDTYPLVAMAPEAVYIDSTTSDFRTHEKPAVAAAIPVQGPALAIGSPATAQDGKYQSLITSLGQSREVERHMVDRLLDGGAYRCGFVTSRGGLTLL